MLLRNNSHDRGDAHQDIYLNMAPSTQQEQEQEGDEIIQTLTPRISTQSAYHTGHEEQEESSNMDDVWGDDNNDDDNNTSSFSPPTNTTRGGVRRAAGQTTEVHVSDIPRLKQEHTTAGYRDGVTLAKAASVQVGFDEGFGLGASIGLHAGRLLGVLTGLVGALTTSTTPTKDTDERQDRDGESTRLQGLLDSASKELSVLSVFGEEYFARDGNWKYEVGKKQKDGEETKDEREEEHIVFADIAAAHPLIRKWDEILQTEARRYGLVWEVLLPEEDHDHEYEKEKEDGTHQTDVDKDGGGGSKKPLPVRQSKGSLAW